MTEKDFREYIYHLVCGNYDLQENEIIDNSIVRNEFSEDSYCSNSYSRMLDAYSRLCYRLGTPEWDDADVECIISELTAIREHIALKMFDYGYLFGKSASNTQP